MVHIFDLQSSILLVQQFVYFSVVGKYADQKALLKKEKYTHY